MIEKLNDFRAKRAVKTERKVRGHWFEAHPLTLDGIDPARIEQARARLSPDLVAPGTYDRGPGVMFFIHTPKTAGMSLGATLQGAFDTFLPVDWSASRKSFVRQARAARNGHPEAGRQVIMGHYDFATARTLLRRGYEAQCAAFVREPVARLVSNYDYNRSPKHPAHADFVAKYPTFEAFAYEAAPNPQCARLSGDGAGLAEVLRAFSKHYTFVGLTEAYGASLAHLGRSHGLSGLEEHVVNRAQGGRVARSRITPKLQRHLYEKHAEDLRLYQFVAQLYGIAP